jgi:hypothetical protein
VRTYKELTAVEQCETGCGDEVQARHYEGADSPRVFTIKDGLALPGGHALSCTAANRALDEDILRVSREAREATQEALADDRPAPWFGCEAGDFPRRKALDVTANHSASYRTHYGPTALEDVERAR